MSGLAPYLRRIEVTLGPLEEWRGETAGAVVQFVSDGTQQNLHITCTISKVIMGVPAPSIITVHNLAPDTRDAIRQGLTLITVKTGWANTDMSIAFQGSVISAVHERSGADIVTTIQAMPGQGAIARGVVAKTFGAGTSARTAVIMLAQMLPGVTVDETRVVGINGTFGRGGWSFAGAVKDALTTLGGEYAFSWSIQDGVFQAVGDKTALDGSLFELDGTKSGMVSVTPLLTGPMQIEVGVLIRALYLPGTLPGGIIRLKSAIMPRFNGGWRISRASYSLDTFSDNWFMDLECFEKEKD